ncbi:homocysteine S-methyltransferase family protein [archaeon]|nr:MAG: homocysteine S-methyltransferase family protein [archaeon]
MSHSPESLPKHIHNVADILSDSKRCFLSHTSLETMVCLEKGEKLPFFASFPLVKSDPAFLHEFYRHHINLALKYKCNYILESLGWRANRDWGAKMGMSEDELDEFNRLSIQLLHSLRSEYENTTCTMLISGNLGPRGDGYVAREIMPPEEAQAYHSRQCAVYREAGVDMVTAYTMTYPEECIGIAWAAREADLPVVISFTLDTDALLPSGWSLAEAIQTIDSATGSYPLYYMINCTHPIHFMPLFRYAHEHKLECSAWMQRIRGLQCNASKKSHAELDETWRSSAGATSRSAVCGRTSPCCLAAAAPTSSTWKLYADTALVQRVPAHRLGHRRRNQIQLFFTCHMSP